MAALVFANPSGWPGGGRAVIDVPYCQYQLLECCVSVMTLQNYVTSIALDAYVQKMPLGVKNGSLGTENDQ